MHKDRKLLVNKYTSSPHIITVRDLTCYTGLACFSVGFQEGRTPLHMACANGFVDAARSLILSGGAKINQLDAVSINFLSFILPSGIIMVFDTIIVNLFTS